MRYWCVLLVVLAVLVSPSTSAQGGLTPTSPATEQGAVAGAVWLHYVLRIVVILVLVLAFAAALLLLFEN